MASVISAGTTSTTALNLSGDTTGVLQLQTNGTTAAMTIDTSQNVGIGTTTPTRKLTVYQNAAQVDLSIVSSTTGLAVIQMGDTAADNQGQIIYRNNGDSMEFAVNGAERMRIDSSGNVGIGVAPSAWSAYKGLNIGLNATLAGSTGGSVALLSTNAYFDGSSYKYITTDAATQYQQNTGEHIWRTAASGSAGATLTFSERMRIASGGQVGIGNSIPGSFNAFANQLVVGNGSTSQGITIYASSASSISFADGTAGTAPYQGYLQYNHAVDAMDFYVNYSGSTATRVRIDSSGNFLVGTTSDISTGGTSVARSCFDSGSGQNGIKIKVNNDSYATIITTGTGTNHYAMYMNNSSGTNVGYIYCSATATTYSTSSDYRLKENVAPMTGALARVQQLKPCTYTWKADGSSSQGFIAHELQAVVPECVTGEKDAVDAEGNPKYQGIDTSFLVATLTAAIQELNAKVEAQAVEIQALKGAR